MTIDETGNDQRAVGRSDLMRRFPFEGTDVSQLSDCHDPRIANRQGFRPGTLVIGRPDTTGHDQFRR